MSTKKENKTPQKIIEKIFIIFFIAIFSYFFGGEYRDFFDQKSEIKSENEHIQKQKENFQVSDIKRIDQLVLYTTPNKKFLDTLVSKIEQAKQRVYIEVYMLTEKRIKNALKKAEQKGIDIKIILEKNPYKAYNINNKTFTELSDSGIDVVWSNPKNYALNHTKLLLIDSEAIISTGNLSYSTFTQNRDFFIVIQDPHIIQQLKTLFLYDYKGIKRDIYDSNLVLSPNYSRDTFKTLFESAETEIKMYFQYFQDDALENILIKKAQEGVMVEAIVSENFFSDSNSQETLNRFQTAGIHISPLKSDTMHAKMISIDQKYLFIGSINFSQYSLDKNREIGIVFQNKQIIQEILNIFSNDKIQN